MKARIGASTPRVGVSSPRPPPGSTRTSPAPRLASQRSSVLAQARIGHTLAVIAEGLKDMWDFESWAPRGARAFRLREVPNEVSSKAAKDEAAREAVLVDAAIRGERSLQAGDENYEAMQPVSRFRQTIDEATKRMGENDGSVLTGESLAEMCYAKYNRWAPLLDVCELAPAPRTRHNALDFVLP